MQEQNLLTGNRIGGDFNTKYKVHDRFSILNVDYLRKIFKTEEFDNVIPCIQTFFLCRHRDGYAKVVAYRSDT